MRRLFKRSDKGASSSSASRNTHDAVHRSEVQAYDARSATPVQPTPQRSTSPANEMRESYETVERVPNRGKLRMPFRRNSDRDLAPLVAVSSSNEADPGVQRRDSERHRRAANPSNGASWVTQTIGVRLRRSPAIALRLSDEISTSESLAKEAARSLRKELEHGLPEPQLRAARLMVILCRNSSDRFRLQIASRRFIDVYAKVVRSSKTRPDVRELMLKAIGVLAYEYQRDQDLCAITALYNSLKDPSAPINGLEPDSSDAIFEPVAWPSRARNRSPKVDLWEQAELAKNNARLLSEALAFTKLEELANNTIISEFYASCQKSQEVLVDAVPWATSMADKARTTAEQERPAVEAQAGLDAAVEAPPAHPTKEEELLAVLLAANQDLIEVFKLHDDMERHKRQLDEEREVAARSIVEQRFDRNNVVAMPDQPGNYLAAPLNDREGSSRSPSPVHDQRASEAETERPEQVSALPRGARPASHNPYAAHMSPQTEAKPFAARDPYPSYAPLQPAPRAAQQPLQPLRTDSVAPSRPHPTVPMTYDEPDEFVSSLPHASHLASQNPYRRHASASTTASQFATDIRTSDDGDELPTPIEPSAKALGKLRRISMRASDDGTEGVEQQAQLEAALRARYVANQQESAQRRGVGQAPAVLASR